MYSAFLTRTKASIEALTKHIQISERFRALVLEDALKCLSSKVCFDDSLTSSGSAPDSTEWRIIDHCASVTRIYAIYEQFVHEMVREHLSLLQSRISFSALPKEIREAYRTGFAKIVEKIDGPRYGELDLVSLVNGYTLALAGKAYQLEARAMLMQEQNLRLPELQRLLAACAVSDVIRWIDQHRSVKAFFSVGDRLSASATSEMAELVKYRNDAAHGGIDVGDILNASGHIEFCEFTTAICEALAERVQLSGLQLLKEHGSAQVVGKIKSSLRDNLVGIGNITGRLEVGQMIYLSGGDYCIQRRINSLQIEGIPYTSVDLTDTELGIMFDGPGRKGASIIVVNPLSPPVAPPDANEVVEVN